MNKRIYVATLLMFLFCAQTVQAEILQVMSSSPNVVWTSFDLVSGQEYQIEVSGTYSYDYGSLAIADAEWNQQYGNKWYEDHIANPDPYRILDLFVNDQAVDWLGTTDGENFLVHTYSPTHIYRSNVIGTDTPLSFKIYDSQYDDNSGFLQVQITPVPEPATLLLIGLGGLILRTRKK